MLGKVRLNVVVAVHELHVIALRKGQAAVAGIGYTGIVFIHQNDAVVFLAEALADGVALIAGAVVDENDFDIFPRLCTEALQAAGNTILCIVYRHDNADERVIHDRGLLFCSLKSILTRDAVDAVKSKTVPVRRTG